MHLCFQSNISQKNSSKKLRKCASKIYPWERIMGQTIFTSPGGHYETNQILNKHINVLLDGINHWSTVCKYDNKMSFPFQSSYAKAILFAKGWKKCSTGKENSFPRLNKYNLSDIFCSVPPAVLYPVSQASFTCNT